MTVGFQTSEIILWEPEIIEETHKKKFYLKTVSWEQDGHLKINHIESNTFNTSRSEQGGEVTGCLGQRVMYPR